MKREKTGYTYNKWNISVVICDNETRKTCEVTTFIFLLFGSAVFWFLEYSNNWDMYTAYAPGICLHIKLSSQWESFNKLFGGKFRSNRPSLSVSRCRIKYESELTVSVIFFISSSMGKRPSTKPPNLRIVAGRENKCLSYIYSVCVLVHARSRECGCSCVRACVLGSHFFVSINKWTLQVRKQYIAYM